MPLRSSSTKSRHGCDRCKSRHVKCNEAVPCNHCTRRNEHCSLLSTRADFHFLVPHTNYPPETPRWSSPRSLPSRASNTPAASTDHPESPTWALDLYLMSHFNTHSVYTFNSYPTFIKAWQTTITRDAVSQPFLLHGMLAVSALHLASKADAPRDVDDTTSAASALASDGFSRRDYVRAFRYHQNEAIPQYRSILQSLDIVGQEFDVRTREPWPVRQAYAMAFLNGVTTAAGVSDNAHSLYLEHEDEHEHDGQHSDGTPKIPPRPQDTTESTRLEAVFDRFVSIFVATRGIRAIVKAALESGMFQGTDYELLIGQSSVPDHLPTVPNRVQIAEWYDMLSTKCLDDLATEDADGTGSSAASAPASSERRICATAIACLHDVHQGAERLLNLKRERLGQQQTAEGSTTNPIRLRCDLLWFIRWCTVVSQEFLALVRRRHEAALVILAQFAAICSLSEDEWYTKNWVKNAIASLRHMLSPGKAMDWVDRIVRRWASEHVALGPV